MDATKALVIGSIRAEEANLWPRWPAEEFRDAAFALQHRHVDIQVHPVDALQLESHMMIRGCRRRSVVRSFSAPVRLRSFGIDCRFGGLIHWRELLAVPHRRPEPFSDYPANPVKVDVLSTANPMDLSHTGGSAALFFSR